MKCGWQDKNGNNRKSLPARGVWIEILVMLYGFLSRRRHSPQGECGLKYKPSIIKYDKHVSLPARGVWIEIPALFARLPGIPVTPRKGSVD